MCGCEKMWLSCEKKNYKKTELQLKSCPNTIYSEDINWSSANITTLKYSSGFKVDKSQMIIQYPLIFGQFISRTILKQFSLIQFSTSFQVYFDCLVYTQCCFELLTLIPWHCHHHSFTSLQEKYFS